LTIPRASKTNAVSRSLETFQALDRDRRIYSSWLDTPERATLIADTVTSENATYPQDVVWDVFQSSFREQLTSLLMHGSGVHTADRWPSLCYSELQPRVHSIPDTGLALRGMDYTRWTSIPPAGEMSLLMMNAAAIRYIVIASQCHADDDVCNMLQSQRRFQGRPDIGCSQHLGVEFVNDETDHCSH
jgi:hypothetical protein